jgi:hypothetical protein
MTKRMYVTILTLLFAVALAMAQNSYSVSGSRHKYWVGIVPAGSTVIIAGDVHLGAVAFSNGATAGTITLTDRGTDCGGIACAFLNATPIAANGIVTGGFGGVIAPGGLAISSTGSTAINAHINYDTSPGQ